MKHHTRKLLIICATLAVGFVFLATRNSQAAAALDISQVQIVGGSPDVSSWPQTATITSLTLTSGGVRIDFDKKSGPDSWPNQFDLGVADISPTDPIQYTEWLFRNVNGTWYGSGFIRAVGDYNNPGGPLENTPCDWFYYVPEMNPGQPLKSGEQLGFMVTAGVQRRGNFTKIQERSDIKLFTVPDNFPAPICAGGGGGGTDTGTGTGVGAGDSTVTVPDAKGTGVTVFPGSNPILTFDPYLKVWLVVAEQSGKIVGQLMTETNKPSGSTITIGSGKMPKVAFGKDSQQFLVTWVSGQKIYGRFFDGTGIAKGSQFEISNGGNPTLYGNNSLIYDSRNKQFVLIWEQRMTRPNVLAVTISNTGSVGTAIQVGAQIGTSDNGSGASIAVDIKNNQYCATFLSGTIVHITPIAADSLTVGSDSIINGSPGAANVGIIHNDQTGLYLVAWQDMSPAVQAKNLNTCADDPAADPSMLAPYSQAASIIYNPTSGATAIIAQSSSDPKVVSQYNLAGGDGAPINLFGSGAGDSPVIAADTATGGYAAAISQNGSQVVFVANAGNATANGNVASPIKKSGIFSTPSSGLPTDIASLIQAIFSWSLSILGLIIFIRFFYAGVLWFTAAGNSSRTSQAKDIMLNAAYGALVLFSAYVILYTINPNLVESTFRTSGLPAVTNGNGDQTACGITSGGGNYSDRVRNAELAVFNNDPALGSSALQANRGQEFIASLVQELQSEGMAAGLVKDCSGKEITNSIIVGYTEEKTGEICSVLQPSNNQVIQDVATANCSQVGPWILKK